MWWTTRQRKTAARRVQPRRHPGRWCRPWLEALEDRTLPSVGSGLDSIFGALQQAVNGHLLLPSVSYSLPLVGKNLGNDPQSQFLQTIGTAVQNLSDPSTLQSAIPANSGTVQVTAPHGSQNDYEIQITGSQLTLKELFDPGLPGLEKLTDPLTSAIKDLTSKLHVDVNLTYGLTLFFALDHSGNVTLDTTQNSATMPLVTINLNAHFDASSFLNLTESFGPLTMDVKDNGSGFTAAVQFNVASGTYPASGINVSGGTSSIAMPNAQATIALALTVDATADANFPGLESDLNVSWNLSNTTDPFDNIVNDPAQPAISFGLYVDMSSVGTWLGDVLGGVANKIQWLKPIIDNIENVLQAKIPILSSLIPSLGTLEDILKSAVPNGSEIDDFLTALDAVVNGAVDLSQFTGSRIPLATVQLPDPVNDDPRLGTFNLGPLVDGLGFQNPSQQASNFLKQIKLPGKFDLPLLGNPLGDLQALLLGENVVLVQWQLPDLNLSANIGIGPFPIFPPLALKLNLGFGITGGLTVGYDTYGFTPSWNTDTTNTGVIDNISEGIFVQDARLYLTGSIGLSAEADLGIVQVGGGGSFNLEFGIGANLQNQGLDEGVLDTGQQNQNFGSNDPYHAVKLNGTSENVLQFGDFVWDTVNGGPLCPFQISGTIGISLSVFVTLGVDPFSITLTYDLGSITIASFNVDTCTSSTTPVLAQSDIKGDNINQMLTNQGLPTTGQIDHQLKQEDPSFAGSQHWILLDLGQFAGNRNVANDPSNPPQDESFEVTPDKNKTGLLVQGFGAQEDFPGLNANTTTILAFGAPAGTIPDNILVDNTVKANAYLVGGLQKNKFAYNGDGDVYMKGGTGPNNLVGGNGVNELVGGDGSQTDPQTNVLIGGKGHNILQGGLAGATLVAGPQNGDQLTGGQGGVTYLFNAGAGNDTMTGGSTSGALNQFQWQEGDGNVTVTGGFYPSTNEFDILGKQGGESWNITSNNQGQIDVAAPGGKTLVASYVEVMSIDSSDQNNDGGDTYTVGDLGFSGIQKLNLNLHEQANPDNAPDHIVVAAPAGKDIVDMSWDEQQAGQNQQDPGHPNVQAPLSHVSITYSPDMLKYEINTAVPKPTDTLHVNTGPGNDKVTIEATQPDVQVPKTGGHVYVNTGAGDDQIFVGTGTLDDFLGPLDIEAGAGHNAITFNERYSYVHDTVTLTATQLIRYTQPPSVTFQSDHYTETAYPFIINYKASGGDFADGVTFYTTYGGTNLYLPETGKNAPVFVNADGGFNNSVDDVYVGFDGAAPAGQSPFPQTPGTSTLSLLRSTLFVTGTNAGTNYETVLQADDEAAAAAETYTLGTRTEIFTNPPTTYGFLDRTGVAEIDYEQINLTLNAGNDGNHILAQGVLTGTSATLNTGGGNDTLTVGNSKNDLNDIGGPLTINGGAGTNPLTLHDDGDVNSESYHLSVGYFHRDANAQGVPAINIDYSGVPRVRFDASDNSGVNTIVVSGTQSGVPLTVNPGNGNALLGVDDLDNIQAAVTFLAGGGTEVIGVNDQTAAANHTYDLTSTPGTKFTFSSNRIKRTGAADIFVQGALAGLFLAPGQLHNNVVNVHSVLAGTSTVIVAGQGKNTINVSPAQNLNSIKGQLEIFGNGPTQVNFDDQKASGGRVYTLTSSSLQFSPTLPAVQLSSVTGITLNAAPGTLANVEGTAQVSSVQLNLNTGTNHVVVGSAGDTLAPIQGAVTITGQTGTDTLVLNDQNGPPMLEYKLSASSVSSSQSAAIAFKKLGSVTLNAGTGDEFFQVHAVPTKIPFTLNGQGSDNLLFGPNQANHWTINSPNSGTLDTTVHFNTVQNLTGGNVSDDFVFQNLATVAGFIHGGSGAETLNFSNDVPGRNTGNVSVTLLEPGPDHGLEGGAQLVKGNSNTPIIGSGFDDIDTLIGGGTSILNGASFIGGFDSNVELSGFAPFSLSVPSDFTGNLRAPGETIQSLDTGTLSGSVTAANINSVFLNGNFTGQIVAADTFGTLTVSGTTAPTAHVWVQQPSGGSGQLNLTNFTVLNGALVAHGASNIATVNGVSQADVTLQADVTDMPGQMAGLIARYTGSSNSYYLAGIVSVGNGYQVNIWRNQNGTLTPLGTAKSISGPSATLKVQVTGSTLKLFVNGILKVTASDTALTTGGVGIRGGAKTSFVNFTDT